MNAENEINSIRVAKITTAAILIIGSVVTFSDNGIIDEYRKQEQMRQFLKEPLSIGIARKIQESKEIQKAFALEQSRLLKIQKQKAKAEEEERIWRLNLAASLLKIQEQKAKALAASLLKIQKQKAKAEEEERIWRLNLAASPKGRLILEQPKDIQVIIMNHRFMLGMTSEQIKLSLGNPERINRSVGRWGIHEQWVYGGTYLYFEDSILTSYQN